MSYTTVEQVRGHLAATYVPAMRIHDRRIFMTGSDYHTLHGGAIDELSVTVKSPRNTTLTRETVVLNLGGNVLVDGSLVVGSITVASDSSLGTIYTENVDYIIDYQAGRLLIKPGGDLQQGQAVTVWYSPYAVYSPGEDFKIDAAHGSIARATGGAIADSETVYIDFTPIYAGPDEEILAAAVRTANDLVARALDPDRQFDEDPVLTTAATYKSLEIACRGTAAGELASGRGDGRVALGWMKMAEDYARLTGELMQSFRPPCTPPASPST